MNTIMIGSKLLELAPYATNLASLYTVSCTINNLMSTETEDKTMTDYLTKTDIDEKIRIYSSMLSEIPHTDSKTVTRCIESARATIGLIECELVIIYNNLAFNKSLCFLTKRARSYSFKDNISNLSKLINILDQRISELERACKILNTGHIDHCNDNKNKIP